MQIYDNGPTRKLLQLSHLHHNAMDCLFKQGRKRKLCYILAKDNNNKLEGEPVLPSKRLFLALVLSDDSKQHINTWRARNLDTLDNTPIPVDNYHVTLVYIGTVNNEQLKTLIKQVKQIKADSFMLTINKTGYWQKPKVLHIMPTVIPPKLINLHRKVNLAVEQAGLTKEIRPYQPHVTLYRKIAPEQFKQLEEDGMPEPNTSININQFAIYESLSDAEGVHYQLIEKFDLTGVLV